MDQFGEDSLTKLAFTIQANKGVYALLLGSGISSASGIKTGWGITCDLIARYESGCDEQKPDAESDQKRDEYWERWYRKKYKKEPDYSDLLKKLGNTDYERQSIVKAYIEPSPEESEKGLKSPTQAHHAIAKLVKDGFIKVIITTNFDRLLEQALHQVGITPTVIASPDDLLGQEPLDHSDCYIIKLHGDYKDSRIKNTVDELSEYPKEYKEILKRIFNDYGLIVCGWSAAWDIALKKAIRSATTRRYSLFWASYSELGEDADQIVTERKGKPILINKLGGADGFFTQLQEKVEQIEKFSLRRPRTEALILSTLKDYLSEPEKNRIRIDDLFKEVLTTKLLEYPEFHKPEWSNRSWDDKFKICENRTQILAKMVGILGIYGKGGEKEVELVCNMIQRICDQLRNKISGNSTYLVNDKTTLLHPAYLVFTIYGIALTKAQRWKELYSLLSYPVKRIHTLDAYDNEYNKPMWYYFAYTRHENRDHIQIDRIINLIKLWLKDLLIDDYEASFLIGLFYIFIFLVNVEIEWNKLDFETKTEVLQVTDTFFKECKYMRQNNSKKVNDIFNITSDMPLTTIKLPIQEIHQFSSIKDIQFHFNDPGLIKNLKKNGFNILKEKQLLDLLLYKLSAR